MAKVRTKGVCNWRGDDGLREVRDHAALGAWSAGRGGLKVVAAGGA